MVLIWLTWPSWSHRYPFWVHTFTHVHTRSHTFTRTRSDWSTRSLGFEGPWSLWHCPHRMAMAACDWRLKGVKAVKVSRKVKHVSDHEDTTCQTDTNEYKWIQTNTNDTKRQNNSKQLQCTEQIRYPLRGALADYFRKDSQDSFTMHSLRDILNLLQQTAVCLLVIVAGQRGYDFDIVYLVVKCDKNAATCCRLRNIVGWTGASAAAPWPGCCPRRILHDHEQYAGSGLSWLLGFLMPFGSFCFQHLPTFFTWTQMKLDDVHAAYESAQRFGHVSLETFGSSAQAEITLTQIKQVSQRTNTHTHTNTHKYNTSKYVECVVFAASYSIL